jgi:hypothetical protein
MTWLVIYIVGIFSLAILNHNSIKKGGNNAVIIMFCIWFWPILVAISLLVITFILPFLPAILSRKNSKEPLDPLKSAELE